MQILTVSGLQKTYTTRFGGSKVQALKNVNFTVESGEYVAIMGESGSGKTTLLNILAALDKPTGGTVLLGGKNLSEIPEETAAAFRRDNLGFVFQDFSLLDTFSLEDNICLPLVLASKSRTEMRDRLSPLAYGLGIETLLLSAGDLVGVLFQKLADAERFRNIDEAGAHLIVALAREDEREIDVILERERVEQVELLKHEPEMIAAERGGLAFADLGKVPPVEQHRAGGGLVERGENVQERRFAAAALAHDGDILALVHGEIDVAERLDRIAAEAGLIYLFQPGNFQ